MTPERPGREDEAYAAGRLAGFEEGLAASEDNLLRRLAAIAAARPTHPIVVLDGRCAVCWREVYESGDYRGGRYRHELDEPDDLA